MLKVESRFWPRDAALFLSRFVDKECAHILDNDANWAMKANQFLCLLPSGACPTAVLVIPKNRVWNLDDTDRLPRRQFT